VAEHIAAEAQAARQGESCKGVSDGACGLGSEPTLATHVRSYIAALAMALQLSTSLRTLTLAQSHVLTLISFQAIHFQQAPCT
jgi:hypothetical protein